MADFSEKIAEKSVPKSIVIYPSDKIRFDNQWFAWKQKFESVDGISRPRSEYFRYLLSLDRQE